MSPRVHHLALATVVVAASAVQYFLVLPGYWVYDDWLYFSLADQFGPLSGRWLGSVYFQHWAPGHRLANSLEAHWLLPYGLVLALMACALGATAGMFALVLDRIYGRKPVHVLAAGSVVLSILFVQPLNWWAAGLQMIPTGLAGVTAFYAYLRWRNEPAARWAAVAAGSVALGLLFYIRAAFIVLYIASAAVFLLEPQLTFRSIYLRFRSEWQIWLALALPVLVYAIIYLKVRTQASGGSASPSDYAQFLFIAWAKGTVPALLGVRIQPHEAESGFQQAVVVIGQVALAGYVVVTLKRQRSAWRAWAFGVVVVTLSFVVIAYGRLPVFGPDIAYSLRYYSDLAWLAPLTALAAWRGAPSPAGTADSRFGLPGSKTTSVVFIAFVIYASLSIRTAVTVNREWPATASRSWVKNLKSSLAHAGRVPVVADARTPGEVVYSDYRPYYRLSQFLSTIHMERPVDGPLDGRRLMQVQPDGRAEPARMQVLWGGTVPALLKSGQARVNQGGLALRNGRACIAGTSTLPAYLELRQPTLIGQDTPEDQLYLKIIADVSSPTSLLVYRDASQGFQVASDLVLQMDPRSETSLQWLDASGVRKVRVDVPAGSEVCFRGAALAKLAPVAIGQRTG